MTSGWRKLAPKVAKMGGKIDQGGAALAIWKPFSSYVGYLRGWLGTIFAKTAEVWIRTTLERFWQIFRSSRILLELLEAIMDDLDQKLAYLGRS